MCSEQANELHILHYQRVKGKLFSETLNVSLKRRNDVLLHRLVKGRQLGLFQHCVGDKLIC